MREFPHLTGASEFPGFGREVYEQIPGAYDSGEWQEGATITMLSVPWGVYDAQIETNVPGFDTPADRDNWFKNYLIAQGNIESHVLDTRVVYQLKSYVELPFTFDYAARYNYMIVDYPTQPVSYGSGGLKRWFFHVTAIDYDSPSCTRVSITPDWWTTCVPLMSIKHMILERGHAPVAASDVDTYLKNPIDNSEYLLAPDLDFGGTERTAHSEDLIFNDGTVYAVISCKNVPIDGDFTNYKLPIYNDCEVDGQPSAYQFACLASELMKLLDLIHVHAPALLENVESVAFIGDKLINVGAAIDWHGIRLYKQMSGKHERVTFSLTKDAFDYDPRYSDLAKLYTAPYAHLVLTDCNGNATQVDISQLRGSGVEVSYALNAAYPWFKVSAVFDNVGGAPRKLTFKTMEQKSIEIGGKFWDYVREYDIPCYSVIQSAAEAYDYQQKYKRDQAKLNADTAYTNATASNATAYTNSANNASLVTTNNAITVAASSAMTARSVNGSSLASVEANTKIASDTISDSIFSTASYNADKDALGVAASNNSAQAASTVATTMLSYAAAGTATGAATGAAAGGVGAIPGAAMGAVAGLIAGGVNYVTASASNNVSQSNSTDLYNASIRSMTSKSSAAQSYGTAATTISNNVLTDNTNTSNNAATSIASNTANNILTCAANTKTTADANAARTKNTADANAIRTRDNAYSAIANATANAGMQASLRFGEMRGGEYNSTRPILLSCNVVTQSKSAIAQVAAQFKRWGYTLNQSWDLVTWNVMKHFSFWQVSDIWATGVGEVPEEGQDAVKRMLYTGVTCWRDPNEIGKVSIYDN